MHSLVIIDSSPKGRSELCRAAEPVGLKVIGFSSVSDVIEAMTPESAGLVEAILVVIDPQQAVGSAIVHPMREVACWVRSTVRRVPPALIAVGRENLSSEAVVDALLKGAHVVVTDTMMPGLAALVQGQLLARAAWLAASSEAPPDGPNGAPQEAQKTLHPRPRLADLPVKDPGWIPLPNDFAITDADPIDLKVYEGKAVLRAIAASGGNRTLAAELLGIGKSTLYRRLSEWRATFS